MYLEKRSDMPAAHKLLAEIQEALGQKEAALEAYKKSLELDSHQDNLVLKGTIVYHVYNTHKLRVELKLN